MYFISTKDNVADVFTKPLEKITFSKHRDVLVPPDPTPFEPWEDVRKRTQQL